MLFNAPPSGRHVFSGESASSMIFRFAYALRNHKGGRDANIVTTMSEHLANYAPYIQLKRDGFVSEVRAVPPLHREDGTIDMDSLASMADHRTRIVAVTAESNLLGNKSDLQAASRIAHENDAILLVDGGVHYMPQALCDVQAIGCDFFVFSSYKMFGPRGGAFAYMSEDAVSLIDPFHVDREASRGDHSFFETGTRDQAYFAAMSEVVRYIAGLSGRNSVDRNAVREGMARIEGYQDTMTKWLLGGLEDQEGLVSIKGVELYGIADVARYRERGTTFSFSFTGIPDSEAQVTYWKKHAMTVIGGSHWNMAQDFYGKQSFLRATFLHYNSPDEVKAFLHATEEIARSR